MPPFAGVKQDRGTPGFLRGPLGFVRGGVGFLDPGGGGGLKDLLNWDFSSSIPAEFYQYHDRDSGATVVDENGNVVWADENILPYSRLTSGNTETGIDPRQVVVGGAYDGGDSVIITSDASNGLHGISGGLTIPDIFPITAAIDVKVGSTYGLSFHWNGAGMDYGAVRFNPNTLVLDAYKGAGGAEIVDEGYEFLGDGWYRFYATFIPDGTGGIGWFACLHNDVNISFQEAGVQAEMGRVMVHRGYYNGRYYETGADVYFAPRLQHDRYGNVLGYLHEPQATNLVLRSNNFFGADTAGGGVSEGTPITSPSGNVDGTEMIISGSNYRRHTVTVQPETDYVFSFWAKEGTSPDVRYSVYDLTNAGDIVAHASYSDQLASGDWERIEIPFTTPAGCVTVGVYTLRSSSDGTVYVWQSQTEEGTVASSLIPTNGAEVTRQADMVRVIGTDFTDIWPYEPVTFVFEGSVAPSGLTNLLILSDSGNTNLRWLYSNFPGKGNSTEDLNVYDQSYFVTVANGKPQDSFFKLAEAFAESEVRGSYNGGAISSGLTTDRLINSVSSLGVFANHGGLLRRLRLLPGAKSDDELQALTTL